MSKEKYQREFKDVPEKPEFQFLRENVISEDMLSSNRLKMMNGTTERVH